MTDKVTVELILENLQDLVEKKIPIGASTWLDGAQKLIVLVGDLQEELFLLEQVIAKKKLEFIDQGDSVAKAKVRIEGLDEFVQARRLEAKIDRVTELVRISKLQSRMSYDNEHNN